jgi:hypothetical protein
MNMKLINVFSVFGLVATLVACGSSQNVGNTPYGYGANGVGYQTGYVGAGFQSTGPQTPLYQSNGQIIGYKTRTPVLGGSYPNVTGNTFTQSVQVNAGDRLFVNLASATYGVASAYCDGKVADKMTTGNTSFPLSNASILLNGQAIDGGSSGVVTAQASGTLTIQANLNPVTVSCGWLFKNRAAQILSYYVNLGGGRSIGSYYGSGAAVEIERCTNIQGAAMTCPY